MAVSESEIKTEPTKGTSRARSLKSSKPKGRKTQEMDGDQVVAVVLRELADAGYPIAPANIEVDGKTIAGLLIQGRVWSPDGKLMKSEVKHEIPVKVT